MSSQQHMGIDTCLHVCVCVEGWGGSCVWVWAIVYVCICHLRDRKIFLASKDKNKVLKCPVSAENGIAGFRKPHTHSIPSLSNVHTVSLKTIPVLVWLNTHCSLLQRLEDVLHV